MRCLSRKNSLVPWADSPRPTIRVPRRTSPSGFRSSVDTPGVRALRGLACSVSQRAMSSGTAAPLFPTYGRAGV